MAKEFPDWIDPWKAADGKRSFSGSVPCRAMERLSPLLTDCTGLVTFVTRFNRDSQRRAIVDIEVQAELPLTCQVSLEVYRHTVDRSSRLVVLDDEAQQMDLPDGYEGTCTEDGRLSLVRLVEDECLLDLPQVPRKPGLTFEQYHSGEKAPDDGDRRYPFAELSDMLKAKKAEQNSGNQ